MELLTHMLYAWIAIGSIIVVPAIVLAFTLNPDYIPNAAKFRKMVKDHPIASVFGMVISIICWPYLVYEMFK